MSPDKQTQLVIWMNQLLFFGFLIYDFSLLLLLIAVISNYIFSFMSEASIHRYYTHRSYKTSNFKEKILRVFAFLTGQGSILSWVTVHRTHHAFEDTEKDPHSPFYVKWWRIYLGFLPDHYKKQLVFDLMRSSGKKYFIFESKYYVYMWIATWIITYFINFYLFFFIVSGSALWYLGTCSINIYAHKIGHKKFSEAVAYNNKLLNFFTVVGYHNNHHKFPGKYSYSADKEIDPIGYLIEKFLIAAK